MDKFATLEPIKLYASSAAGAGARFLTRSNSAARKLPTSPLIGRLPTTIHRVILLHLQIPDIPAYALVCRATRALTLEDKLWERKWLALGAEKHGFQPVLDRLDDAEKTKTSASRASLPPTLPVSNDADEFGDFAAVEEDVVSASLDEMGDFVGAPPATAALAPKLSDTFDLFASQPKSLPPILDIAPKHPHRQQYIKAHNLLKPLTLALASNPPHLVLSVLSSALSSSTPLQPPSLRTQAKALHLLALFLSGVIQPLRSWPMLVSSLRSASDRLDATLLAAFDVADGKSDEEAMKEAAEASWELRECWSGLSSTATTSDWEMGKVWAEKREIFYEQGKWDPLTNFRDDGSLDFDAMDEFISAISKAIDEHGSRAARVFPPASQVLLFFADRLASDIMSDYITTLLTRARELQSSSSYLYLQAAAATFKEAWRIVDAIMRAAAQREGYNLQVTKAEDVVYQMFEINMDEYLDEEVESLKRTLERICKGWSSETHLQRDQTASGAENQPRFLDSSNPAQVKRNVLASFTSVLLLPVTIVPRTVGAVGGAIMTGGSAAAQGIAMLNPQRWGGSAGVTPSGSGYSGANGRASAGGWRNGRGRGQAAYSKDFEKEGATLFEVGQDEEDERDVDVVDGKDKPLGDDPWAGDGEASADVSKGSRASTSPSASRPSTNGRESTSVASSRTSNSDLNKLELLISLDIALEVIHADRESLKRVETFAGYPGHYGHRVRDTIEEIFILMLQTLGDGHMFKGFGRATEQMMAHKPAEHEITTSVTPLLQFFELVHIGDTIQSMVQVYFDKELAQYIDRTDFLNVVVREKKKFENSLDDSVAGGLNAGTQVLMNQVEHIIITLTKPREYYPVEDASLELGPTKGCTEAIKCLEKHCKLLKGSTSKEVLEVFYQEIGIRLIAILQKHIKRQIISLSGGFQLIADLNTYHAFISSLKVPSMVSDFSHLKMLGHVYVVEDAKDLAQIVRDVTRYGGAYRPEDIYEFIQRRSDWKRIEKTVDKTMYNLSFKEDCIIC